MKKIKIKKANIIKGIGLGGISFLAINSIFLGKKLNKLAKSHKRFLNLMTDTEESRQKYELFLEMRLESLEEMVEDMYIDIEDRDKFEVIDREEI